MALKKSELYASLWQSCDELRGGMDASQYKDYVLVLLFIKYVSDKYAGQTYAPITIPPGASFKDMVDLKGKSDIGDQVNKKIIASCGEPIRRTCVRSSGSRPTSSAQSIRRTIDNPRMHGLPRCLSAAHSSQPVELVRLLEHVTVNLALGNTDAHAKNTSAFHDQSGGLRLTPMYDVAPTLAFIPQRHFGVSVAGKFVITEITREHLVREARAWGMPERVARATIDRTLDAIQTTGVGAADDAYPGVLADVRAVALQQIERLGRA